MLKDLCYLPASLAWAIVRMDDDYFSLQSILADNHVRPLTPSERKSLINVFRNYPAHSPSTSQVSATSKAAPSRTCVHSMRLFTLLS